MSRTGRPKLDPAERKKEFITFRLTERERNLIDKAAAKSSQKLGDWARETLISSACAILNNLP